MGTPTEDRRHELLAETKRLSAAFDDVHCHWREVASLYASGAMSRDEYDSLLDAIIARESRLLERNLTVANEYWWCCRSDPSETMSE